MGQHDLRYLNVWSDVDICSTIGFNQGGDFIRSFSGSYTELRDKPTGGVGAPEYYEALPFFPDKSLTLTAQSNNLISGLALEASGAQLSYFRVDRLVCNELSVLNGPIKNVAYPELPHHAATKGYVDQRFLAYTPTDKLDLRFQATYATKSDLQTTDQRMLTLLRNISLSAIPDLFAFLEYNVTFLYRMSFPT